MNFSRDYFRVWLNLWNAVIWIRIQLGPWIRIRIPNADPDPGVYNEGKIRV